MIVTPEYPKRVEDFELVLLKTDVSEFAATPADFKRVHVAAEDQLQAMMSEEAKVSGYRVLFVSKPGVPTEPEILARRRELDEAGHTHIGM